jgi:hypothetical protein
MRFSLDDGVTRLLVYIPEVPSATALSLEFTCATNIQIYLKHNQNPMLPDPLTIVVVLGGCCGELQQQSPDKIKRRLPQ